MKKMNKRAFVTHSSIGKLSNLNLYYLILFILCSLIQLSPLTLAESKNDPIKGSGNPAAKAHGPKLLVWMIDGFRWDYYENNKDDMDAFEEFLSKGVQAEYMDTVFPSNSYPAWTTISTGVYPENHEIIGNYMYDQKTKMTFDIDEDILTNVLHSTRKEEWWQYAEPIWITAIREKKKTFLRHWSRCDVPYKENVPGGLYSGFPIEPEKLPGISICEETLNLTLQKLEESDLLMVYCDHIDNIGHTYGPDSPTMKQALEALNRIFKGFLDKLMDNKYEIYKELNIIIIGDHGMKHTANATLVKLEEYLNPNDVLKVVGKGGYVTIQPLAKRLDTVYNGLKGMPGVDIYKREDIPENYHYKKSRLVLDILIVAKDGYYIAGLRFDSGFVKQIPTPNRDNPDKPPTATHGYLPSLPEMRTIFFAKGPQFKEKHQHPPIQMEDVYLIMTRVLEMKPQPNNGSWPRVSSMFVNTGSSLIPDKFNILILITALIIFKVKNIV